MRKRHLLKWATSLALLPTLRPRARPAASRLRPSDPEWPNAAAWQHLNDTVGGRLIEPNASFAAAGADLIHNPYFLGDQPGATETSGWVDAWMSSPSIYAVAAQSTSDVVAAVNFARDNNLRVVVKGGGHSYLGTSNSPDSLLIWTRAMNRVELHDAFVAQGSSDTPQRAVSVGAGATWIQAYDAVTTKAGRYVQGGGCTTVGVAGLLQSGGFGSFSKNFGTAAGSLLEAEAVTADGTVRIANAHSDSELFWGLKGGGGGSLGVVTRVTLKTHDLPEWFGGAFFTVKASSTTAFRRLIGEFIAFYRDNLFNPHWGESVQFRHDNTLAVSMVSQGLDSGEARTVWQPFLTWLAASPADFTIAGSTAIGSIPARAWWDVDFRRQHRPGTIRLDDRPDAPATNMWWSGDAFQVGWFLHGYESVWLPAPLLQQQERLADALFATSRLWPFELHFNKGLAGGTQAAIDSASDTATNPAMLNAFALAIMGGYGPSAYLVKPDLGNARREAQAIAAAMVELRKIVPDPGAYVSESSYFERDWQRAYWGDNYPRLRAVKAHYDPNGLFFVHHGVGCEDWSADGFTRLG